MEVRERTGGERVDRRGKDRGGRWTEGGRGREWEEHDYKTR